MAEFMNYLMQVSVLLIVLYLPYRFLFRNETRFNLNRAYLLTILVICWIIPFINIPVGSTAVEFQGLQLPVPVTPAGFFDAAGIPQEIAPPGTQPASFSWMLLYWPGLVFMLIRNLWVIARIIRLSHRSERYRNGQFQINVGEGLPAFTFFNNIFLSRAEHEPEGNSLVIWHESAHARQRHTWDLVLAEFIHTILWFNPILILYKKALKETHEYLADRAVLKEGVKFQEYALSLQSDLVQSRYQNLVSHFKGSTIKKRIIMATKTPNPKSLRKYFLIFPVLLGCLILWSFIQDPVSAGNPGVSESNLVVMIDPGHGGKDPGATNPTSAAHEKDICLALAKCLGKMPHPGIDFVFTRNTDVFISLETRIKMAEENHADLFISLHMNASKNQKVSGSEFWYSIKNPNADVSREICRKLGTELKARKFPPENEPFSSANFVVLSNTKCPSVHYSFGYITNDEEAKVFTIDANLESLAGKIISSIQEVKKKGVVGGRQGSVLGG